MRQPRSCGSAGFCGQRAWLMPARGRRSFTSIPYNHNSYVSTKLRIYAPMSTKCIMATCIYVFMATKCIMDLGSDEKIHRNKAAHISDSQHTRVYDHTILWNTTDSGTVEHCRTHVASLQSIGCMQSLHCFHCKYLLHGDWWTLWTLSMPWNSI
jgi:hypothetical protein